MNNFPIDIFKATSTPFYFYDLELLDHTLKSVVESASIDKRFNVHYAIKANARPEILRIIARAGLGADCVSGGEINAAISAGFKPDKIVYAGVGKTDKEIRLGLSHEIECFNIESMPELDVINSLAHKMGLQANVAIRVNPGIDAHTHKYITTGTSDNKFGIPVEQLDEAVKMACRLENINLRGLHFHIGSQITEYGCFKLLCERINEIVSHFKSQGINFEILNVGGGLGIDYDNPDQAPIPDFKGYFEVFAENLDLNPNQEVHFELGRSIIAQCGSLITRVLFVKDNGDKKFAIVDAGMSDLIRPALYQAHHVIEKIHDNNLDEPMVAYDVVGPICESSDVFDCNIMLPGLKRHDILSIRSAGAYGETMASQYNLRALPRAIFSEPNN